MDTVDHAIPVREPNQRTPVDRAPWHAGGSRQGDVLVRAEAISKKFCRSLKRSLWYGLCDIGSELLLRSRTRGAPEVQVTRTALSLDALDMETAAAPEAPGLRTDEFWAVKDVSFELRRGECLGLIGHNGAGKTTLLKMLNGLVKIDHGRIEMWGRTGALIALGAGFNPLLTGRENIYVNGSVLGLSKSQIDAKMDEILNFAEIGEFIDAPVQNYSSGMNVRLGFAVAVVLIEPDILFLDEVLAVGDIGFRYKCFAAIGKLMRNSAVVLVSHDMGQVQRICTSIMFMQRGKIRYYGSDVAGGIQRYQASLVGGEQARIVGTGRACVSAITVSAADHPRANDNGVPLVSYGEDLRVAFDLTLDASVQAATVTINVLDQGGMAVAQCDSSDQGFVIKNAGRATGIVMRFPQLPLSPGIYRLWLIVRNRDEFEPLAVHHGVAPFQVVGHFVGYIPYQPRVEWKMVSARAEARQ